MILMILVFTILIYPKPSHCCRIILENYFNVSHQHMQLLTLIFPPTNKPYQITEMKYLVVDLLFS